MGCVMHVGGVLVVEKSVNFSCSRIETGSLSDGIT